MSRFRGQLVLGNNTWSASYIIPQTDRFSNLSTDWILVSLIFTVQKYGSKLIIDQIDTPHADMWFSNITITYSMF